MPKVMDSRSSILTDPLRNFKFLVNINHVPAGSAGGLSLVSLGFQSCSGLSVETSVVSYREGGFNSSLQKMPGQSEFSPITLMRGCMINTPHAWEWMREIFSTIQGGGTYAPKSAKDDFRGTVDISVLTHPYTKGLDPPTKLVFKVYNAWPSSIGFSDLDAGGNAILMEQMVLQHEGFNVAYATNPYDNSVKLLPEPAFI